MNENKCQHIAVYVRVSTKSQDHRSQLGDLEAWAKNRSEPVVWYLDTATGTNMDRPAMEKMQKEITIGNVLSVVCWRLDRLGRTAKGLIGFFDELREKKVNLISLKDGLDLSTPAGRMMATVLTSVAVYEIEVKKERQTAGIAAAKASGKKWGGSEKGRLLWVSPEQIQTVKELKSQGRKIAAIARSVGLSRPTVYRLLEGVPGN